MRSNDKVKKTGNEDQMKKGERREEWQASYSLGKLS